MEYSFKDRIPELDRLIDTSRCITLVVHMHPDGDAIGSGIGMMSYLRHKRGKDVLLVTPDRIPETLAFLIPQEGVTVYEQEPEGVRKRLEATDLVICLDFNAFSRLSDAGTVFREATAPKVLIDHHLNPEREGFDLIFSETGTSSASELLFWILMEMPDIAGDAARLPRECAAALMTGMTTDTNNFANSVSAGTLEMASRLLDAGVDRDRILHDLYNSFRENRVRLMGYLLYENLRITARGVAFMILRLDVQERFGMQQGESEGFVNIPLSIADVRMSLLLTEEKNGHFRVSIRSKQGISANACARRYFNGGGHELAAGGNLFFPGDIPTPDDAQAYILNVTERLFENEA